MDAGVGGGTLTRPLAPHGLQRWTGPWATPRRAPLSRAARWTRAWEEAPHSPPPPLHRPRTAVMDWSVGKQFGQD
eukprot:7376410-Prymnesium_polylepis.1